MEPAAGSSAARFFETGKGSQGLDARSWGGVYDGPAARLSAGARLIEPIGGSLWVGILGCGVVDGRAALDGPACERLVREIEPPVREGPVFGRLVLERELREGPVDTPFGCVVVDGRAALDGPACERLVRE